MFFPVNQKKMGCAKFYAGDCTCRPAEVQARYLPDLPDHIFNNPANSLHPMRHGLIYRFQFKNVDWISSLWQLSSSDELLVLKKTNCVLFLTQICASIVVDNSAGWERTVEKTVFLRYYWYCGKPICNGIHYIQHTDILYVRYCQSCNRYR